MANPTVYKYPRWVVESPDGTLAQIDRSVRANGDVSTIVKVRDERGHTLVLYHYVHDAAGNLVHGPHEVPGSRDPGYTGTYVALVAPGQPLSWRQL